MRRGGSSLAVSELWGSIKDRMTPSGHGKHSNSPISTIIVSSAGAIGASNAGTAVDTGTIAGDAGDAAAAAAGGDAGVGVGGASDGGENGDAVRANGGVPSYVRVDVQQSMLCFGCADGSKMALTAWAFTCMLALTTMIKRYDALLTCLVYIVQYFTEIPVGGAHILLLFLDWMEMTQCLKRNYTLLLYVQILVYGCMYACVCILSMCVCM